MNKLKSDINGGIEFNWDDFRFEQNAVREAIEKICAGFESPNNNSFRLFGADLIRQGSVIIGWAPGWVVINGEPCVTDGGNLSAITIGNGYFWEVFSVFDPAGLEPMENGQTANTYEIRKARIVVLPVGSGLTPASPSLPTMQDLIRPRSISHPFNSSDYTVTGGSSPTWTVTGSNVKTKWEIFGKVLKARVSILTSNVTGTPDTFHIKLPTGYVAANNSGVIGFVSVVNFARCFITPGSNIITVQTLGGSVGSTATIEFQMDIEVN
jgi:hypothetical protein